MFSFKGRQRWQRCHKISHIIPSSGRPESQHMEEYVWKPIFRTNMIIRKVDDEVRAGEWAGDTNCSIHVFSSATVCSSSWSEQTWKETGDVSDSETEALILKRCSYIRKDGWTAAVTQIFDAKSERDEKFKEMRETDKISQARAATLA